MRNLNPWLPLFLVATAALSGCALSESERAAKEAALNFDHSLAAELVFTKDYDRAGLGRGGNAMYWICTSPDCKVLYHPTPLGPFSAETVSRLVPPGETGVAFFVRSIVGSVRKKCTGAVTFSTQTRHAYLFKVIDHVYGENMDNFGPNDDRAGCQVIVTDRETGAPVKLELLHNFGRKSRSESNSGDNH